MRRKAFTLVELLVVIAIISLLISILMPSLKVAESIARQTTCASNMNSVGRGLHLYCELNRGRFPPYRSLSSKGKPYGTPHVCPEPTFWVAKEGDLDPVTLKQRWRSLGFLYKEGQLPSPDYYYCPAQTGRWFSKLTYTYDPVTKQTMPWGTYDSLTTMIRIGYLWNVWGAQYPVPGGGTQWDFAARSIDEVENDKALVIDHALFPWYSNVHMAKGLGKPTFNTAFADGHVEGITSSLAIDVMLSGGVVKNWVQAGEFNDWHDEWEVMLLH